MLIVGLNSSGYVSSAAIVVDGKLAFACAEERLDRRKYSKYFPHSAIDQGLAHIGARIEDVDRFAVGYNPAISVASRVRAGFSEWPGFMGHRFSSNPNQLLPRLGVSADLSLTRQIFQGRDGIHAEIDYVAHHLAHAANAYLLSGFPEAAIFTCDGYGERTTTTWGRADGRGIDTLRRIDFPHSMGSIYATFTQFLGFTPNGDEWKLMGAAAHGDPARYRMAMRQLVHWDAAGNYEVDLGYFNYFDFDLSPMYREKFIALFGPPRHPAEPLDQRHFDLAAGIQELLEQYLHAALSGLREETRLDSVCLSGGVLMNSLFNGKTAMQGPFERSFVPYAPDDNGNSIGAALWLAWQAGEVAPGDLDATPYLGNAYDDVAILAALRAYGLSFRRCDDIVEETARALAAGKVVGWFQGRMEFGDRALGARSILADPRDAQMRARLNNAVKYREDFRPFAPAILAEEQLDYFESERLIDTPYMERALPVRLAMRSRIPAAVHADGTARLQTVRAEANPLFYQLIERFKALTGVPVLINTSFNVKGEPIVASPTDAIRTFYSSGIDVLAIGSFLLEKGSLAAMRVDG